MPNQGCYQKLQEFPAVTVGIDRIHLTDKSCITGNSHNMGENPRLTEKGVNLDAAGEGIGIIRNFQHENDETVLGLVNKDITDMQSFNNPIIGNFVENIRHAQHPEDGTGNVEPGFSRRRSGDDAELEQARMRSERAILEAEKFHATVELPPTGNDKVLSSLLNIGTGMSDDDFFHLTCHIEPSLIHKIEKGEFVELEKLLPKDKLGKSVEENRLEWVQRDRGTFLVPAQRDNKISGFRRWEQAFRVHVTIYCGANPHTAKEIWQYITVINTAALAYSWDNVYNYDITFRHLMAFNPQRSWAVTYNQMWNLSMRDPLPKQYNKGAGSFHYSGGSLQYKRGVTIILCK